ncbi:hypothetical protein BEWA_005260 [Theileria equi strain WA]|uniref:Uncharacterized protein n=1 Tax=Theileria equi strain WA TaxID=1537102 RepID=L0B0S6_THEEQ|nr:hypothetical protein BEWA_005260 [Theileria equi strain WA]AFZ81118.1 hypothetical protein BEWA_005260 [Theileria equi strain WA]|eukprot:XP_004830784.1 hypothetical protein BEWA_005260 [Theileria equi strain WA]
MYNSGNAATFRDPTWTGQSTVRRYCIEPTSTIRQIQSDPLVQENSDVLKLYVVSRCNYSSYDKSFLIPQPLSYLSETDAILNTNENVVNDIFDDGVSSSDDDLFNNVALDKQTTNTHHSVVDENDFSGIDSPESLLGTLESNENIRELKLSDQSYDNIFDPGPFSDDFEDDNLEDIVHTSLKPRESEKLGISDRKKSTRESKAENKATRNHTTSPDSSEKPIHNAIETSKLNLHSISGGKLSQTPFRNTFKLTSGGTGAYEISKHFKKSKSQSSKLNTNDSFQSIANSNDILYKNISNSDRTRENEFKHDDYHDINDFESDGDYDPVRIPPSIANMGKKISKIKKNVSSADLLNTWYLTHESHSKFDINWKDFKEYSNMQHNTRYPKRTRLPPVCHWDASNGSKNTVCIYKTKESDRPLYESIPEVSLVISEGNGNMKMQIVEESRTPEYTNKNQMGKALPITDYSEKLRQNLKRGVSSNRRVEDTVLGNIRKRSKKLRKVHKPDLSVDEALDILKNAPDDHSKNGKYRTDKTHLLQEEMRNMNNLKPNKAKEAPIRTTDSINVLDADSTTEYDGQLISYKSIYKPDDVEAQIHDGNIFKLMIMAQFRTSIIVIPGGNSVNFGNVNSNLIFGYLFSGENIKIKGLESYNIVNEKDFFYLPMYNEWSIENNSKTHDAVMFLSFVNV